MKPVRVVVLIGAVVALALTTPSVARSIVDYARNAGRLDGKDSSRFAQRCKDGSVMGWAQVTQQSADYVRVPGFTYIKSFRRCEKAAVTAKGDGQGRYLVRFGEKACSNEVFPPAPMVVTAAHADTDPSMALVPSYSTICDDGLYAFEITLRDLDGVARNGTFTAQLLQLP